MTNPRSKKPASKVTSIDGARRNASGATATALPDVQGLLDLGPARRALDRVLRVRGGPVQSLPARLETFGLSARVVAHQFPGSPTCSPPPKWSSTRSPTWTCAPKRSRDPRWETPRTSCVERSTPCRRSSCRSSSSACTSGCFWWLLPVGLTVAWGTTQAFTVLSWSLRDRKDHRSYAGAGREFDRVHRGRFTDGGAHRARGARGQRDQRRTGGGTQCLHRVQQHPHLSRRGETLVALPRPGFHRLGALFGSDLLPRRHLVELLVSTVLVVAFALGPIVSKSWRKPTFSSSTRIQAGKFLLYGLGCGLLTSAVIGFATHSVRSSGSVAIAAGPLLVTLGLMERQLRSFRSRTALALRETTDLAHFGQKARAAMVAVRSMTTYIGVLMITSTIATTIALVRHETMAPLLILTVDAIGITFFLALIMVSAGLINRVLLSWLVALAAIAVALVTEWVVTGHVAADWASCRCSSPPSPPLGRSRCSHATSSSRPSTSKSNRESG